MSGNNKKSQNISSQRQSRYINSWSITETKKYYDALEDKHASYYFIQKSVKQRLKSLNKAVNNEKNFNEKQRLKTLIREKIKLKFPNLKNTKLQIYANQLDGEPIKISTSSKKQLHKRKASNFSLLAQKPQQSINLSQMPQREQEKSQQLQTQLIHNKKHRQFISFLQRKKSLIQQKMKISSGPDNNNQKNK